MKKIYTQDEIEEMRKRLYDRGAEVEKNVRHKLSDEAVDVSRDWSAAPATSRNTTDLRSGMKLEVDSTPNDDIVVKPTNEAVEPPKKRHYRSFILLGSLLVFFFVAGISSLFLYFGGNQISNDNIQLAIQGPSAVGGGETTSLQISVTNQNSVDIESVTLILKYPNGTQSIGDTPRNLYEERISLEDIAPGEVRNIPVQVALFGEENAEKQIEATMEYRINGSNGVFYKDADPLVFRVNSSPLVLRVENIKKVASGQLVDVTLTAVSNASTPLRNILITASYPNGFTFESSKPDPVYGQNVWRIDELLPEGSVTIKLKGIVTGLTEETFRINFDAGPADSNNQYLVSSKLTEANADFEIERPFIQVEVAINRDSDGEVIIPEGEKAEVEVKITNTLDETVYDMTMEVVPKGNALNENSIDSSSGFYDSNKGTVRWEVSNNASFERVLPGDSRSLEFTVNPGANRTTSSFDIVVNVYARRVGESSAAETLIGSSQVEAKYSSSIALGSQAGRNVGRFGDSGPIPPKVGEITTYTITLVAEAGANDMTNAVVETSLPVYVNWLEQYDVDGEISYNSVSKRLQWVIGDISSGDKKEFNFQVSIQPSVSQIGEAPILLNVQKMRANDRFTNTLLQDSASPVTTELSTEMGFPEDNGEVVR